MNITERYLKQATRGLWGKARRELRAELSGHLNERVAELRLGNLSTDEAERQALRELGAPEQVSVGMLGVHTVPAVGKTGAVGLLAATVLFSTLPQGLAQVKGVFGQADNAGTTQFAATGYLDVEELKATIKKAGGQLSNWPDKPMLTLPDIPSPIYITNAAEDSSVNLTQGGRAYIRADSLIMGVQNRGADLRLIGWSNPTLQIGESKIQIRTDDWRVINGFYRHTLFSEELSGYPFNILEPNGNTGNVSFSGSLAKDHIYALVTPIFREWYMLNPKGEKTSFGNVNLTTNIN